MHFLCNFFIFRVVDCFVMVCKEENIRIWEDYLLILKKLFMIVNDYNDAMRYVYNLKYFKENFQIIPNLCCKVLK